MPGAAWKAVAAALVAVSALALTPVVADSSARSRVAYDALETSVVAEVNALRASHGLPSLRVSPALSVAAEAHSRAMASGGFFSHSSADGSDFWRRIERHYGSRGYGTWSVGENLAWASPELDASGALRMWLESPPHRRVLLTAKWREIGLAAVRVPDGPGVYGGLPVTIVTVDFGVRR